MTARQVPGIDELRPGPAESCPCGHGDVGAEIERQRPLVMRAIQGDPAAFATLYDDQVDDIYRYLLAWTWDSATARDLTGQVFRDAVTWLPAIAEGKGDLGAWLIALARDAVGQHLGAGWTGEDAVAVPPREPFDMVDQLDAAQREVVVLRLLLGHSAGHTAHLAGYDVRVVHELQLAACSAIWQLLSGVPLDPPPHGRADLRPRWFEHYLAGAAMDPGADPALGEVLAVAEGLRQGAPERVPLPDDAYVAWLRSQLLYHEAGDEELEAPPPGRLGRAFAMVKHHIARHPWAATVVAAVAIGLVIGLQLAGGSAPTETVCSGASCVSTTAAASADQTTSPSLPVLGGPGATTTSTLAALAATSSSTRTSATSTTTRPSATVPPTTAQRTTTTVKPTTTTKPRQTNPQRTTTTTVPPTTSSATTTGAAAVLGG
jgi:DNA-directed RNA polymerase specialized sigma24 family protein